MGKMPLHLHVNQKSDYDDMMRSTIRVSNSLDPSRPGILGPNCLQKISAEDTSR